MCVSSSSISFTGIHYVYFIILRFYLVNFILADMLTKTSMLNFLLETTHHPTIFGCLKVDSLAYPRQDGRQLSLVLLRQRHFRLASSWYHAPRKAPWKRQLTLTVGDIDFCCCFFHRFQVHLHQWSSCFVLMAHDSLPEEPITCIFRGYNYPCFGGWKASFFMGTWGPRVVS